MKHGIELCCCGQLHDKQPFGERVPKHVVAIDAGVSYPRTSAGLGLCTLSYSLTLCINWITYWAQQIASWLQNSLALAVHLSKPGVLAQFYTVQDWTIPHKLAYDDKSLLCSMSCLSVISLHVHTDTAV